MAPSWPGTNLAVLVQYFTENIFFEPLTRALRKSYAKAIRGGHTRRPYTDQDTIGECGALGSHTR